MPAISTCPRCRRQVSLPVGAAATAAVRCPLCEAEYLLSEALALAPPELILVAGAAGEASPVEDGYDLHGSPSREGGRMESYAADEEESADEEHNAAIVAERIPAGVVAAQFRNREKSHLGKLIGLIVGGLAGCAVAYFFLLPLLYALIQPAEKREPPPPQPAFKRVKPDYGKHRLPETPQPPADSPAPPGNAVP